YVLRKRNPTPKDIRDIEMIEWIAEKNHDLAERLASQQDSEREKIASLTSEIKTRFEEFENHFQSVCKALPLDIERQQDFEDTEDALCVPWMLSIDPERRIRLLTSCANFLSKHEEKWQTGANVVPTQPEANAYLLAGKLQALMALKILDK